MNAAEAKKLTNSSIPELSNMFIRNLENEIQTAARRGYFCTDLEIGKIENICSITNKVVEHFQKLGFETKVSDLDLTVKVSISWFKA
ncbi:hypothetical protein [Heyndrickxia oleronia]|uniref:hypothetical protein n=1 Tax=Heyndrickxia oleronia TaxID=38875 RepID=UPI0007170104|nr:hypothetical protein [Heyndrickxia oleronia]MBU5212461.1 hypothetical protein [Heyndrickxia oleronia]